MNIATKLNPRFERQRLSLRDAEGTGPVVLVCDCVCPCGRPIVLPEVKGILEYPSEVQELKQSEWIALLANYTVDHVVHRFIGVGANTCGWDGWIRNGEVLNINESKKSDAKVKDVAGVAQRAEERRQARKAQEAQAEPAASVRGRKR